MKPDEDDGFAEFLAMVNGHSSAQVPVAPPKPAHPMNPVVLDEAAAKALGLTTVAEVLTYLNGLLVQGEDAPCPCCTKFIKRYRRPLSSPMARWLMHYVEHFRRNPSASWLHVTDVVKAGFKPNSDFAKLRYWGLVEERPQDASTKNGGRTTGYWCPTAKGEDFVEKRIKLPSHAQITLGVFEGLVGKDISIQDALGKDFDYDLLMRNML